ncbi:aspartic proteinase Asp1 isoform X1 [Arachis duranensis]|uniref:Aspartic proteinase Asp1 n=1 Tax=Arachis duranensis TaxID=130453 RepID=A0A6P4B5V2_ARADU|nr:aspartic proteinase Asp1 isoform X1 [Arachis duranensis]
MSVKSWRIVALHTVMLFLLFFVIFPLTLSAVSQPRNLKNRNSKTSDASSAIFQVEGNVYPLGHYTVSLSIGNPPKLYDFDIDSGSDLTWVQCDAPCKGCTKPPDQLYKPKNNLVQCGEELCAGIHLSNEYQCAAPSDQCDYEVEYADQGSSLGVLVRDQITLPYTNGSVVRPRIGFGCGYHQKYFGLNSPPSTAGVLGLGRGIVSFLSQLHALGLIRDVIGHCLSVKGGGFLFFGDDLIPSSGVVWIPMFPSSLEKHYSAGPAKLLFDGKLTSIKDLELIFDSGSSYTYLNSEAYQATVDLVSNDLKRQKLERAIDDDSLPICWKGAKPFKSLGEVKSYFKPLALSFQKAKDLQFQLPPESYLIITKHGNACLGILDGTEVGLEKLNIIGDISLQDKIVIYDNENKKIGWVSANCDRLSVNREVEEGFPRRYATDSGIFSDRCPAIYGTTEK